MDFALHSRRNVPDDCIISIRAGSLRRQGAVTSEKPFRFPQNLSADECVVKVDIMRTIGSGYMVMRPNQAGPKTFEVVLNEDEDMACELEVSPAAGEESKAEVEDSAAAKVKQDAKVYLEETGLLPFVQGVLQVVAKQQPRDPFASMAKHFLSASDEAVAPADGKAKVAPESPKEVIEAREVIEAPTEEITDIKCKSCGGTGIDHWGNPCCCQEEASREVIVEEKVEEAPKEEVAEEKVEEASKEEVVEEKDHEHVNDDDHKSDTLEELTKTATLPAPDAEGDAEVAATQEGGEAEGEAAGEATNEGEDAKEEIEIADKPKEDGE